MYFPPNRLALICAIFLASILPGYAGVTALVTGTSVPPVFLTGSNGTSAKPYYGALGDFGTVPVGKTLVVPIVVSGSGPMKYTATSSSPAVQPIIKTGNPVMNIAVSYSGTTAISGTTLYSFSGGSDGGNPYAGLITGTDGNLYGTTESGTNSAGTVYEITTSGSLTTLHTFTSGSDGGSPYAGLAETSSTDGNFYGTTETGGTGGDGTVFQITSSGSLTTLYSFSGTNGANSYAGLVTGSDGQLYGTTSKGGTGDGTVFKITTSGSFTLLHAFAGGSDGGSPYAGLATGTDGNLYGTTAASGTGGYGTVYRITTSGSLATVYSFSGGADGGNPYGVLIQGANGNFYGTTESGGSGYGTVFQITTSGSLMTLHTFTGGNDGGNPHAGLILGSDGNFYGTTETDGSNYYGTVFQITTSGSLTTVHTFAGGSDGANPYAALYQPKGGTNIYGTTETDGSNGQGTVFQINVATSSPFSGTMVFAMLRDMAPTTCGYIAGFAEAGYYNDLDFFRITDLGGTGAGEFIAQGGDPTETGTGSVGFTFDDELAPSLIFTGEGQLAMANSGIDTSTYRGTNGAQFFITKNPIRSLDFNYTIFGQLLQGFDVMQKVMGVTTSGTNGLPTVPVVMNSVTVSEDNTDAVMLVNAAGYNANATTIKINATDTISGSNAVIYTGTVPSAGLSIPVSTVDDTINDPPIIEPEANIFTMPHQKVAVPIKTEDLEFDYLVSGGGALSNSSGASVVQSGNNFNITPNSYDPLGNVTLAMYTYEPLNSGNTEAQTAVTVDLGSGIYTGQPAEFLGTPGNSVVSATAAGTTGTAGVFGSFLSSNPNAGPSNFTATINWGDGTALESGTGVVSVVKSTSAPTTYDISYPSGHAYTNAGIYPLTVTVTDSNGGTFQLQNTAVVGAGPIYAFGRTFAAAKGTVNGMVATFLDKSPLVNASGYKATINWGDGSVGSGFVRGSNGSFEVYGSHQYTAGTTYPVDVTIQSLANSNSGYAWSTAKLSEIATHQPPFAQSHIIGQLGSPGFSNGFIDEEVTLFNSGNKTSGPVTLKFYLSPNQQTDPISSSAVQLKIGKNGNSYTTVPIPAGAAISGAVSEIVLPPGYPGKYIIMQVITSDPLGNHMDYPREFVDTQPLL